MVIVLTVGAGGRLLASPDIITRGYIATKENARQLNELRGLVRRIAAKSGQLTSRARIDALKDTLQRQLHTHMYDTTGMTPLMIPVVNVVNAQGKNNIVARPVSEVHS